MSETMSPPVNRQQRRQVERQLRKQLSLPHASRGAGNVAAREQSALQKQPASRLLGQREANRGIALLEQFDGMAALRNGLQKVAAETKEWAGIPMAMEGCALVIEPSYPNP